MVSGSSAPACSARRARSAPLRHSASGSWLHPAMRMEVRSQRKRWSVVRVASDRLIEKAESLGGRCQVQSISAQVEVVGGQIGGRTAGRTGGLRRLQRRRDNAGDADRHIVLKVKYVFERAVEAVGP